MQTKEGLLSAETLGSTTARTESQRQQFNTDFVVFSFCILKATTYQIFASFRKGETKAWRQAANIVHQAQSEFLTHATGTWAIELKQRSALFEAIQCKSGPPCFIRPDHANRLLRARFHEGQKPLGVRVTSIIIIIITSIAAAGDEDDIEQKGARVPTD